MSAAAGAPPPPPPPPPPRGPTTINDLPAELLLIIFNFANVGHLMDIALAIYPIMRRHNLAPELTVETVIRIATNGQRRRPTTTTPSAAAQIPVELWAQVTDYLEPSDILALVFAIGPLIYRPHGPPNQETMDRLRVWSRRARKK